MKSFIKNTCRLAARGPFFRPQMLFFHGVEHEIIDPRIQVMQIRFEEFERFISYLKRNYEIVDLDDLVPGQVGERYISLTFDDGYLSNYDLVAPYLQSEGIPFTIYLTASAIGTKERIPTFIARVAIYFTERASFHLPGFSQRFEIADDASRKRALELIIHFCKTRTTKEIAQLVLALNELLSEQQWEELNGRFSSDAFMDWSQVQDLHNQGVTIGAHGYHHIPLHGGLTPEEVTEQVIKGRDEIVNRIGNCVHYAFPNGTVDDISRLSTSIVSEAGFLTAATTVVAPVNLRQESFLLPRICCYNQERFEAVVAKQWLDGSPRRFNDWAKRMRS